MRRTAGDVGFAGNDRFVIERQLGAGSMGAVYLAYDRKLAHRVALKVLLSVEAGGIYRFKKEFRALADVTHENLVTLHELFSEGDRWFFTMQYVQGKDLLTYVHGGRRRMFDSTPQPISERPSEDTIDIPEPPLRGLEMLFPSPLENEDRLRAVLVQVVNGLQAVHAADKLHRDLKPENIMVTSEGHVVLLDFGIVVDRLRDIHETLATVIGTPAYMSPEQCRGQGLSEATDWYSLGVILYEALTGDVPFDGPPLKVLQRKQEIDPVPPNQLVSGVPEDLNTLCMQLLQRDAAARPDGDAIRRALRGRRAASIPVPGEQVAQPRTPQAAAFVGRGAQLLELHASLERTEQGEPVIALLNGAPGIGKTTLVERFVREVVDSSQAIVLRGRCYERESVPFKAFDNVVDSLSRYLRKLPPVDAARMLPREIDALAELFPVLKRVEMISKKRRQRALPIDPQEVRACAFRALKEMFGRIADLEPLVVYIDDLQWCDVDSAKLISELVTGEDKPALMLLCVYRSGDREQSHGLSLLLEKIAGAGNLDVRSLALGVLSPEDSVSLARALLTEEDSEIGARKIGFESGGNPQMLTQLVRHVEERLASGKASPETARGLISFERVLEQRLASLSTDARTLLELLSIAARPVPESMLALTSSFNIDLATALTELRAGKLVRGVATRSSRAVEVYHDTIREAIVSAMQVDVMVSWHRRLAAALEASGAIDLEALTDHLLGAGDRERASLYAARAAEQAERGLAFDKAARLYGVAAQNCVSLTAKLDLHKRWADALVGAGRGAAAARVYVDAATLAGERQALELRGLAGVELLLAGELREGLSLLHDPLIALNVALPDSFEVALPQLTHLWRELRARGFAFQERSEAALDDAQLGRLDLLWGVMRGLLFHELDRPMPLLVHYVFDALELGEPRRIMRGLLYFHLYVDAPMSRRAGLPVSGALDVAQAIGRRHADVEARAALAFAQGATVFTHGDIDGSLQDLLHAEELYRNHCKSGAHDMRLCRLLATEALSFTTRDDDQARLREWLREAELRNDRVSAVRLRLLLALGSLRSDDVDGARTALEQGLQSEFCAVGIGAFTALVLASELALYARDIHSGHACIAQLSAFLHTPFGGVAIFRKLALLLRTRLALLARLELQADTQLLELATTSLDAAEHIVTACWDEDVLLLQVELAVHRGEHERAASRLAHALERAPEGREPSLPALVGRRIHALLVGGHELAARLASADAALARRGIENPRRFARLYCPTLREPRAPAR